jgi:hypothetical protein
MEARTVNNLPPAAPHDDAVRCLLLCRTGNYAASRCVSPAASTSLARCPVRHSFMSTTSLSGTEAIRQAA